MAVFTTNKMQTQPPSMCVVDLRDKFSNAHNSFVMNTPLNNPSDSCLFSSLDHMIVIGKLFLKILFKLI